VRWIRNLVHLGLRFGDRANVVHGLGAMGIGAGSLCLAASVPLLGRRAALPLGVVMAQAVLARARYLDFTSRATGQRWPIPWLELPLFVALDLAAWARALVQLLTGSRRYTW
jgi:hypothetical protein